MSEIDLKYLWEQTKEFVDSQEKKIVDKYISFLREVAVVYIKEGIKVYFRENKVVHYGEGGFGTLIIIEKEDKYGIINEYIPEIRFESDLCDKKSLSGYIEIKESNIGEIKYEIQ